MPHGTFCNSNLHRDLHIPTVKEEIKKFAGNYEALDQASIYLYVNFEAF